MKTLFPVEESFPLPVSFKVWGLSESPLIPELSNIFSIRGIIIPKVIGDSEHIIPWCWDYLEKVNWKKVLFLDCNLNLSGHY